MSFPISIAWIFKVPCEFFGGGGHIFKSQGPGCDTSNGRQDKEVKELRDNPGIFETTRVGRVKGGTPGGSGGKWRRSCERWRCIYCSEKP